MLAESAVVHLRSIRDSFLDQHLLKQREREVACLLIKGLSLSDIADGLGLAIGTVKGLSMAVYQKTNTSGRSELVSMVFPT